MLRKRLFTLLISGVLLLSLFCGCSNPLPDMVKPNESIPGPPLHSGGNATTAPTEAARFDTTYAGTFYFTIYDFTYRVEYNSNHQIILINGPGGKSTFYQGMTCLEYVKHKVKEVCSMFANKPLPPNRRVVILCSINGSPEDFLKPIAAEAQSFADEQGYKTRILMIGKEQKTADGLVNLETAKLIMSLYWDIPVEDVILLQGLDPNRNSCHYLFSNGTQTRRMEGLSGKVNSIPE